MRPPSLPLPARFGRSLEALGRRLRPLLLDLPGAGQRRRGLLAAVTAAMALLLRPWPPFRWLPGWCIGALLLWALAEAAMELWWPRRWR